MREVQCYFSLRQSELLQVLRVSSQFILFRINTPKVETKVEKKNELQGEINLIGVEEK